MTAIVISDLHIGSKYFLHSEFARFMETLPPNAMLILDGDVVDYHKKTLSAEDHSALARIRQAAMDREVVWVLGNHDRRFKMPDPGKIRFCQEYIFDGRVLINHGYDFDQIMPRHQIFIQTFRLFHRLRVLFGAESMHVARYAKKFSLLYGVLRRHVMRRAVRQAKAAGCKAVICGHTHFAEEEELDGIRYFNTGSWTEPPLKYVWIGPDTIQLRDASSLSFTTTDQGPRTKDLSPHDHS